VRDLVGHACLIDRRTESPPPMIDVESDCCNARQSLGPNGKARKFKTPAGPFTQSSFAVKITSSITLIVCAPDVQALPIRQENHGAIPHLRLCVRGKVVARMLSTATAT